MISLSKVAFVQPAQYSINKVQQQVMCFSGHSLNNVEMQKAFESMSKSRSEFTQSRQFLPKSTVCLLEYIESVLKYKVGISDSEQHANGVLGYFLGDEKHKNVRKQFQKAFESFSSLEQINYYRQIVTHMTGKEFSMPMQHSGVISKSDNSEISFEAEVKGKFLWSGRSSMKLIPQRHIINLRMPSLTTVVQLNLRNYILRRSKQVKADSYALFAIVPVQPMKLRFAICRQNKDIHAIKCKIKAMADQALRENVNDWIQPITPIPQARFLKLKLQKKAENPPKQKDNTKNLDGQKYQLRINEPTKDPMSSKRIEKAKEGVQKKPKELTSIQIDQEQKGFKNLFKSPKEIDRQMQQKALETSIFDQPKKQEYAKQNNQIFMNILNLRQSSFKKKPVSPQSQDGHSLKQSFKKPRKQPLNSNYASHGASTRSEAGLKKMEPHVSRIECKNYEDDEDRQNSGKSLLDQIMESEIMMIEQDQEQQQFGNVSEISHDSDLSFQTVRQGQM